MKWFLLQSFATIVVTALLTMVLCWIWFRARYRVVRPSELISRAGVTIERTSVDRFESGPADTAIGGAVAHLDAADRTTS